MRDLHLKEYKDYLIVLRNSIFQILPLYEKENPYLIETVKDISKEVDGVLDIIDKMPNGAWYFSTKSGLKTLVDEVQIKDNKKAVRKKVLHLTAMIQKQADNLGV